MRRERFSSRVLVLAFFVGTACSGLAFSQTLTIVHAFTGSPDGAQPASGLFQDSSGTFYGTTSAGGSNNLGTVFTMDRSGNESVLYSFAAIPDGNQPFNSIPARDQNGNVYGTTIFGGRNNYGTLYKITPTGQESVVYSFCSSPSCADGEYPYGTLIIGADGNLYGTAYNGGPVNQGLIYKISPTGQETVLHNFTGQADGGSPYGSLLLDRSGNFYGTTSQGGTFNVGVVYKLSANGQETVLHNFGDGNDGAVPFGGLTFDAFGNIYGTTLFGGTSANGTVFKITSMGAYSVLHNFAGGTDGSNPYTALVPIPSASLGVTTFYGTTDGDGSGSGTIYKITSNGEYSVVYNFTGGNDGAEPDGQLLLVPSSSFRGGISLYGTALGGGSSGLGVVFKLAL